MLGLRDLLLSSVSRLPSEVGSLYRKLFNEILEYWDCREPTGS